ncbi:patatin-like phospholipase family protein [Pseudoxanthomonas dokdonensis]|uniref:PNPLA domain-containing protein n=1 Tax=Pseudoxanthomonas dokdonensis TaxID=344882 RepID=A0A0R0CUH0_9GAMM|nr:patatin-like phospholipase family protein [Pseudoxanthomonas dokdonensis]KRG70114.1 hypothetical protein ABB29_07780 [Pseudoxanthomonas dokdonensis]
MHSPSFGFNRWTLLRTCVLVLAGCVALPAPAQPRVAGPGGDAPRPRTCLVLGGGGARGAAHVGLLKVLDREHIAVDCIVGTSMGAVVGGLYAAGYSADQIEDILDSIDWNQVLRDQSPRDEQSMRRKQEQLELLGGVELGIHDGKIAFPRGILQGQRMELLLRRLLLPASGIEDFDDLPIPFRAVATDIVNGQKVVFERGDLALAIRASMSVPAAFSPIRVDGRLLVDGGVVDNVPIDEARKLGAQRMIVSQVGSPLLQEDQLTSPLAVSQQMANILMQGNIRAQIDSLGADDLLIVPQLGDIGSQEFQRSDEARQAGQAAAEQAVASLRRYAGDPAEYASFQQRHRLPGNDVELISFVRVLDDRTGTATYVEQRLQDNVGKPLDVERLESDIATVYGEGRYEKVQWELASQDGRQGLQVTPVDKDWGPDFLHFGLRLSDDFDGGSNYQLLAQYTRTGLDEKGSEFKAGLGIGEVVSLYGQYFRPFGATARHGVVAGLDYRATEFPIYATDADEPIAEFRYALSQASLAWRFSPDRNWAFALGGELGKEHISQQVGDLGGIGALHNQLTSVSLSVNYDSLDSVGFPTRGQRLSFSNTNYFEALGGDANAQSYRLQWDGAWSHGQNHWLAGVRGSSSEGGETLLATYGFLGGLGNLSGYPEQAIFASQIGLARLAYYHRLVNSTSLVSMPVYWGGTLEMGGFWDSRDQIDSNSLIGAGSVFLGAETFLGPVFLGYGRAETGHDSFYLTFGSLLRGRDPF